MHSQVSIVHGERRVFKKQSQASAEYTRPERLTSEEEMDTPQSLNLIAFQPGALRLSGRTSIDRSCSGGQYSDLYEIWNNVVSKLTSRVNQIAPTIYIVTTKETTFALIKAAEFSLCEYTLVQTEHSKLFILETQRDHTFKIRSRISLDNLDIFAYVNSKFVYVETSRSN
ncbi:hypothetical protein G5I_04177 [Acromyrmex echinatior]|uniref:Uncharacterized protein n=1 Tax=Acromyrmex echinatior TaxID=103372 RepID=F4WEX3_ACREC|nr:hypothetical protein G5I_04177 [Acromyrmex echinatior]